MPKPPTLDEIDLGKEKRRIEFDPGFGWGYVIAAAVIAFISCGAGVGIVGYGMTGGRAGTNDNTVMAIIGFGFGSFLLLLAILMAVARVYFSNERLIVFKEGICWQHHSKQECYRWKDIEKIVEYPATPGVYWLYFKAGRKIPVSVLSVDDDDWQMLRNLLEKKVPSKFVEE